MGLSFTIAAGPRQHSHSQVQVSLDSRPQFTVSDSRLPQLGGPGPRIYIPQEEGGPVIPPGTGFPFRPLLWFAGLRWRYSTPPPHGLELCYSWILVIKPRGGPKKDTVSIVIAQQYLNCCLPIRCRRNVFTGTLPSNGRLLWLCYFCFRASCHNIFETNSQIFWALLLEDMTLMGYYMNSISICT
jgi:hypothetical protein